MRRHRSIRLAFTATAIFGLTSCSDDSTQPTAPPSTPDLTAATLQQESADDPVALARTVPGFGGFFLDEQGTATVYLTNPANRAAAVLALTPWFRARNRAAAELRVVQARFAWSDLERWTAQAAPEALAVPGAVFADADEAGNRIHLGVENTAAASQVRTVLARLGVPAAAAAVDVVKPVRQLTTLRGVVRPVVAGVQINFSDAFNSFACSLGFNATRNGVRGFVTASHCTKVQGGTENTAYFQPLQSTRPTQIATETVDPVYRSTLSGCPVKRTCRRSDAAFAKYINGTTSTLGSIAKTATTSSSDLTIAGHWAITSNAASSSFTVGQTMNKVGRTTGWSRGKVTATCATVNVSSSPVTQICQTIVRANVRGGDSGSPVFSVTSGSTVRLTGVLWGGGTDETGATVFVFSPFANITGEVGGLTTH